MTKEEIWARVISMALSKEMPEDMKETSIKAMNSLYGTGYAEGYMKALGDIATGEVRISDFLPLCL